MSTQKKSQLFGRRACATGFHPSQYHIQPANCWFDNSDQLICSSEPTPPLAKRQRLSESVDGTQKDAGITKSETVDGSQEDAGINKLEDRELPGIGTVMAILDTGIQYDHLAFSNHEIEFDDKVIECRNFLNPEEDCEDFNGHGTECAGMACGLSFAGEEEKNGIPTTTFYQFNSPAPGAKLMVCKVGHNETDNENASMKAITDALKYIVAHNDKITSTDKKVDVISISFGYNSFNKELALAIQTVISKDIIVVCCASNDGTNIPNPITYPGRLGHVICIGACDMYGQPAKFSSVGKEVDFVELGEGVWAPTIGYGNNVVTVLDGTSYSTPSVAGLICRLLQDLQRLSRTRNHPTLYKDMHNVWCMRELLKSMSVMQGHHDKAKGYGKLIPHEYFKKGEEERVRICDEILGNKNS